MPVPPVNVNYTTVSTPPRTATYLLPPLPLQLAYLPFPLHTPLPAALTLARLLPTLQLPHHNIYCLPSPILPALPPSPLTYLPYATCCFPLQFFSPSRTTGSSVAITYVTTHTPWLPAPPYTRLPVYT